MDNRKKILCVFPLAAILVLGFYLFGPDSIRAQQITGDSFSGSETDADDAASEADEQVGPMEEGESDEDPADYSDENENAVLSDDFPLIFPWVNIPGNYAWQNLNTGELGSFGHVNWRAGYEFIPKADASVTELCGFFDGSVRDVELYNQSFDLLAKATVESDNGWNCVPIDAVGITEGQIYYAVAKAENDSLYYKYQCGNPPLLPRTVSGVIINAGVRQPIGETFGSGLKRYPYLVFGLVDVKISSKTNQEGQIFYPAAAVRPKISDPQPTGTISNSKPLLSVRTDKNTTCRYSKTKKNYADMEYKFTTTGKKSHTKRIGVLKDGKYTRYVRCKSEDGKISLAEKITFTVKNGSTSNIHKPVISNPLPSGTISDNTSDISVTTDEDAACKYSTKNVSYNDSSRTAFFTTGGTSHSSTIGPLNDGDYIYYVRCIDKAGNANISSKKIVFTVATGTSDTTPPTISDVSVSPASGKVGTSFTIKAKVTDASGVKSAEVKIQHPDGTTVLTGALYDDGSHSDGSGGDNIYGREVGTTGADAGKYYVDIVATDTHDNISTKNNGATFTLTADATSCVPPYEPNKWNVEPVQSKDNCYNYANDKITYTFAQPGRASGQMYASIQCSAVVTAAKADGLVYLGLSSSSCSGCTHTVALVADPGVDYHWYRKDNNNMWSHKPGTLKATNVDASSQKISDPKTCNRNYGSTNYDTFCGYFCADKTKVDIN